MFGKIAVNFQSNMWEEQQESGSCFWLESVQAFCASIMSFLFGCSLETVLQWFSCSTEDVLLQTPSTITSPKLLNEFLALMQKIFKVKITIPHKMFVAHKLLAVCYL